MKDFTDTGALRVIACPHPFKVEKKDFSLPEGYSLLEILSIVQPKKELLQNAHVFVNDAPVPRDFWKTTFPVRGDELIIRVVPSGGGGGKNPLATILSIAVIAASYWAGPYIAGPLLHTSAANFGVVTALSSITVGAVGYLAISALVPPPSQNLKSLSDSSDSPTYSLSGGRNRLALYQPIPQVFGRHLLVPPYAAPPYTELIGQDQYLVCLFLLGYGPLSLESPKIGETSIYDYSEVELELRHGTDDDTPITLYKDTINTDSVGTTLTTGYTQRTSALNCDEISLEFLFPQGLIKFEDNGDRTAQSVVLDVQYSVVGSGTWKDFSTSVETSSQTIKLGPGPGGYGSRKRERYDRIVIKKYTGKAYIIYGASTYFGSPSIPSAPSDSYSVGYVYRVGNSAAVLTDDRDELLTTYDAGHFEPSLVTLTVTIAAGKFDSNKLGITRKTASAFRIGAKILVDTGQYYVRVKRASAESTADNVFDSVQWAVMRTITNASPTSLVDLDNIALAALRIKANTQLSGVVDQFNIVATSVCQDYDSTTSGWVERATSNPASLYRHALQGPAAFSPVSDGDLDLDALEEFHSACTGGEFEFNAVIEKETTMENMLNNILSAGRATRGRVDGKYTVIRDRVQTVHYGHLTPRNSWGVKGEKTFTERPDALRINFVNEENNWQQDEVIAYQDGQTASTASSFETLDLFGITLKDLAWRHGRYFLAVMENRPGTHSRMVDFEHLVFARGDFIRVTDDVALHGIASGRLTAVNMSGAECISIDVDEFCTMTATGTYGVRMRLNDGASVYSAVSSVEGENSTLYFPTNVTGADIPSVGDLFSFGETEQETSKKLVTKIEMTNDLAARVYYVDLATGVHAADDNIPSWDAGITIVPDIREIAPPAPEILAIISDDNALVKRGDGTIISRIMVSVAAIAGNMSIDHFEGLYRLTNSASPWRAMEYAADDSGFLIASDVEDGEIYDIKVRGISRYGVAGAWVSDSETVIGKADPPPDVSSFLIRTQSDGTRQFDVSMDFEPADLAGYKIRYHLGSTGYGWDDLLDLHDGLLVNFPYETNQLAAGAYTFAVKAEDTSGIRSTGANFAYKTLPDPRLAGAIEILSEYDDAWPGTASDSWVNPSGYLEANDSNVWNDLTNAWNSYASSWNTSPTSPISYERTIDIGAVAVFTPLVTVDADGTETITESHSTAGATWTSYATTNQAVTARYIKIKTTVSGAFPLVRDIQTILSAAPLTEDLEDIATSGLATGYRTTAGDIRLPITENFVIIKRVDVALQNVGYGWSWELIDKDTTIGPRIKIYNASDVLADATIDATVKGL